MYNMYFTNNYNYNDDKYKIIYLRFYRLLS